MKWSTSAIPWILPSQLSRNHMDVEMRHRLTGGGTDINTEVKAAGSVTCGSGGTGELDGMTQPTTPSSRA